MSLTLYRARRSRNAQHVRAAILFEAAVVAVTLIAIAVVGSAVNALFLV